MKPAMILPALAALLIPSLAAGIRPMAGSLELAGHYGGEFTNVARSGNLVFLAQRFSLMIVDASDPARPVELSRTLMPGRIQSIAADGPCVIAGCVEEGYVFLDATNPAAPVITRREIPPEEEFYYGPLTAKVAGGLAVLQMGWATLEFFNVENPASPLPAGGFTMLDDAVDFAVKENRLALIDELGTVRTFDIRNPAAPYQTSAERPAPDGYGLDIAFVNDHILVLLLGYNEAGVWGTELVSSGGRLPESPRIAVRGDRVEAAGPGLAAVFDEDGTTGMAVYEAETLAPVDQFQIECRDAVFDSLDAALVTTEGDLEFRRLDIPSRAPFKVMTVPLGDDEPAAGNGCLDFALSGGLGFVAMNLAGISIFEPGGIQRPAERRQLEGLGAVTRVAAAGRTIYALDTLSNNLFTIDAENWRSARLTASVPVLNPRVLFPRGTLTALEGAVALTAAGVLLPFDASDPLRPEAGAPVPVPGVSERAQEVDGDGRRLYAKTSDTLVSIFDFSAPAAPVPAGTLRFPSNILALNANQGRLLVSTDEPAVYLYDEAESSLAAATARLAGLRADAIVWDGDRVLIDEMGFGLRLYELPRGGALGLLGEAAQPEADPSSTRARGRIQLAGGYAAVMIPGIGLKGYSHSGIEGLRPTANSLLPRAAKLVTHDERFAYTAIKGGGLIKSDVRNWEHPSAAASREDMAVVGALDTDGEMLYAAVDMSRLCVFRADDGATLPLLASLPLDMGRWDFIKATPGMIVAANTSTGSIRTFVRTGVSPPLEPAGEFELDGGMYGLDAGGELIVAFKNAKATILQHGSGPGPAVAGEVLLPADILSITVDAGHIYALTRDGKILHIAAESTGYRVEEIMSWNYGWHNNICSDAGYLAVSTGSPNFHNISVFRMISPSEPALIYDNTQFATGSGAASGADNFSGGLAYALGGEAYLSIVPARDPAERLGGLIPPAKRVSGVVRMGDLHLLHGESLAEDVHAVDFSDPANGRLAGSLALEVPPSPCAVDFPLQRRPLIIQAAGSAAYAAGAMEGMKILDFSNPAAPVATSSPAPPAGCASDLALAAGSLAWLDSSGVGRFDLANPLHPVWLGYFDPNGENDPAFGMGVFREGIAVSRRGRLNFHRFVSGGEPVLESTLEHDRLSDYTRIMTSGRFLFARDERNELIEVMPIIGDYRFGPIEYFTNSGFFAAGGDQLLTRHNGNATRYVEAMETAYANIYASPPALWGKLPYYYDDRDYNFTGGLVEGNLAYCHGNADGVVILRFVPPPLEHRLREYLLGIRVEPDGLDLNGDGRVDAADLARLAFSQ